MLLSSVIINIMLIATMLYVQHLFHSEPVDLDRNGHLVIKPGCTVPGRSIDAAADGWSYQITRHNSYKAADWKPKTK